MRQAVAAHLSAKKHYKIVDVGSCMVGGQAVSHRSILERYQHTYVGLDVVSGPNVDVVMTKPYRIPIKSASVDAILCGQVFEHVPFFWVSFLEMTRLTRTGGYIFMTVPSRGHVHNGGDTFDGWRFYPDSMRGLAAFAGLELLSVQTDFPPRQPGSRAYDYTRAHPDTYWGDTVAVFRKTKPSSVLNKVVTEILVRWANRQSSNMPPLIAHRHNRVPRAEVTAS
jgi:SAM-dependent methyltransferase